MIQKTERSIEMTTDELAERDRNLRHALEDLTYAAAGYTGNERTRLVLAMTLVSGLLASEWTTEDHREEVERIVNQIAEDCNTQAVAALVA